MPGGKGKIHEHPNAGINNLKHRKQDINRTGQNRKTWTKINKELKEKGFEKLDKQTYENALSYLFTLPESEIKELANDKDQPLYLRLMLAELTDPNTRGKTLTDWRNYLFAQKTEIEVDFKSIPILNINPLEIAKKDE